MSRFLRTERDVAVSESEQDDSSDESNQCIQKSWDEFQMERENNTGFPNRYCNATWDSVYCWPFAAAGTTLTRPCSEVMQDYSDMEPDQIALITGNAIRICGEDGTWLWGNWTNYNECLDSLEQTTAPTNMTNDAVVDAVRWILFLGSIMSFISLATSLFIFHYFKSLKCERVTVHVQLMLSLALRFVLLIIITEPYIFQRSTHYRTVDWICKIVMSLLMYATVASINWMFIQGHYLHGRLTTNIFDKGAPFKIYFCIGWVLPLILILAWAATMETHLSNHCWQSFSRHQYIWILVGPMILALFVNLLFLINIMRILLTKIQRANTSSDAAQFRRAVKATGILFPLLGINNLLFVYNPGGSFENVYMVANTVFLSSQGVLVSLLYCFFSNDVREALRREYRKFHIRRSANSMRRQSRQSILNTSVMFLTPRATVMKNGHCGTTKPRKSSNGNPSPESLNLFRREQDSKMISLTSSPVPSPLTADVGKAQGTDESPETQKLFP